jgi:hypothetical protein
VAVARWRGGGQPVVGEDSGVVLQLGEEEREVRWWSNRSKNRGGGANHERVVTGVIQCGSCEDRPAPMPGPDKRHRGAAGQVGYAPRHRGEERSVLRWLL